MAECKHYKGLLSGMLDGELTSEETVQINEHLIRCASCRADYDELRRTEDKLEVIGFTEITDDAARAFWKLPYSRAVRNASLLMIVGGYATLLLYAFVSFLTDDGEGTSMNDIAGAAIVIGFLVLLGMIVIERIQTYKVDPYKEIER
jgi:predicted anti-sigma-YlaC factor YlaD